MPTPVLILGTGKGGVGKTSIAVNVADILADRGHRILLIDTDAQGDAALTLGITDHDGGWAHVALVRGQDADVVADVRPGLDLLPAGDDTDVLADVLARAETRHGPEALAHLGRLWRERFTSYDLIVVDTPPARQSRTLTDAVLMAGTHLLIPTRTDVRSIRAIRTLAGRYGHLRQAGLADRLDLAGVVLFATGTTATAIRADTREALIDALGTARVLDATVRYSEKADRDATLDGLTVREYAAAAAAADRDGRTYSRAAAALADDYRGLADEIGRIVGLEAR